VTKRAQEHPLAAVTFRTEYSHLGAGVADRALIPCRAGIRTRETPGETFGLRFEYNAREKGVARLLRVGGTQPVLEHLANGVAGRILQARGHFYQFDGSVFPYDRNQRWDLSCGFV
jgi:hypothetical protein